MIRKLAVILVLMASVSTLSGCLVVTGAVVGGAVVGGLVHATSSDGNEVVLDTSYDTAYQVCRKEMIALGSIESEDYEQGILTGYVNSAFVEVELERTTGNAVRVEVSARRVGGLSPSPATAQRVAFGVVDRLEVARGPVLGGAEDGSVMSAPIDPTSVEPAEVGVR
ncbi:MAG: hypothetical protein RL885_04215 [Planctomycetota bacterium]